MTKTLPNAFFEKLKKQCPQLSTPYEYGVWFAQHTAQWSAKEMARLNIVHIDSLLRNQQPSEKEALDQLRRAMSKAPVRRIVYDQNLPADLIKMADLYLEDEQKAQAWGWTEDQWGQIKPASYSWDDLPDRTSFLKGFFSVIQNTEFSVQHAWLLEVCDRVDRSWGASCKEKLVAVLSEQTLPVFALYPWSKDARPHVMRNLAERLWEQQDTQIIQSLLHNNWAKEEEIGEAVCHTRKKMKDHHLPWLQRLMDMRVPLSLEMALTIAQKHTSDDLVEQIVCNHAPNKLRAQTVKEMIKTCASHNATLATRLLDNPKLCPQWKTTVTNLLHTSSFGAVWGCLDAHKKDELLAEVCRAYVAKHPSKGKDLSFMRVMDFVQTLAESFPIEERHTVALRMLAVLSGEKSPALGVLLQKVALEHSALNTTAPRSPGRKM